MKLTVATANLHKFQEIREMLPPGFKLNHLRDIGVAVEIPETGNTFIENARMKAQYVHSRYNLNCLADDSGLEVEALHGAPGVFSARYAGPFATSKEHVARLLNELKGITNRRAMFTAVLVLILDGREHVFEGRISGTITERPYGEGGFGYDPVFIPDGFTKTFAEMPAVTKNQVSHRAQALSKMVDFLSSRQGL